MNKEQIIEAIESMTVLELSELVKALEEKFGVSAAAPVAVAAAPAAGGAAAVSGLGDGDRGVRHCRCRGLRAAAYGGKESAQVCLCVYHSGCRGAGMGHL